MSEEVKKTEDKKSESKNTNSRYKGKGPNKDNRQKRGPPLSPAQQRRKAAEERISNWTPKTELGRKVVSGEITTIQDALATGLPLRAVSYTHLTLPTSDLV